MIDRRLSLNNIGCLTYHVSLFTMRSTLLEIHRQGTQRASFPHIPSPPSLPTVTSQMKEKLMLNRGYTDSLLLNTGKCNCCKNKGCCSNTASYLILFITLLVLISCETN